MLIDIKYGTFQVNLYEYESYKILYDAHKNKTLCIRYFDKENRFNTKLFFIKRRIPIRRRGKELPHINIKFPNYRELMRFMIDNYVDIRDIERLMLLGDLLGSRRIGKLR